MSTLILFLIFLDLCGVVGNKILLTANELLFLLLLTGNEN